MPQTEFYYFPLKALGEPIRMLLAYGGEDWKDNRISSEDWPAFKPKTPFGQMPLLVVGDKQYAQSIPIARYLGRKHGLAGADLEEDFLIDQHVEFLNDIRAKAALVHYEQDPAAKAKKHEDFSKNLYPGMLAKLDQILKENNGHLALGKLTWGDFVFAGIYPYLKAMLQAPDLDERYPAFKKLEQTVYSIPKVKAYADAAPKTDL
ncbi:glutathione S-transferase 2-like [Leguminivora glycinivorella]|uniref:glutathione S-transferase 2-like n=1 Tax=Leguminivora glycinivorella TaxID=1035111 RepID=UPI00200C98AF|nr:glutathione S-transferase 2-like [Leguminivora glycinivorella]XP_047992161.1 glutathione S-transferase 2-like [Leguminivora glycinivorella]